jgi:hypothetical protein
MVKNRDVKWDRQGRPVARVNASGETPEGPSVPLTVEMSAIGMPTNTPLVARRRDGQAVEGSLRETSLARTPRSATPKETADLLNMDTLPAGFRRFVAASSGLSAASMFHLGSGCPGDRRVREVSQGRWRRYVV